MAEFEGIAGKVNDLSNQSTDFVLSGTEGIIAKRNAIDDEARSEKANLRDLEKKLAYVIAVFSSIASPESVFSDLSRKTGGLLQRATPLHGHGISPNLMFV